MFYLDSTIHWLDEVVNIINIHQLDPVKSVFMISFFNSMDNDFVNYFKLSKERISSVSGRNFHIFTPLIYENGLIPDGQWREIKKGFSKDGIVIKSLPTFVFFNLEKISNDLIPRFFAVFEVSSFDGFNDKLKRVIECCVANNNKHQLTKSLTQIFLSPNLIIANKVSEDLVNNISTKLNIPKIFVSHSSLDKPFVKKLIKSLSTEKINCWLDENEINVGDDLSKIITNNLRDSDFLLLTISKNSANSKWVHYELSQFIGFKDGKRILPILIDSSISDFPEPLKNDLIRLKYIDFSKVDLWDNNVKELIKAIKGI